MSSVNEDIRAGEDAVDAVDEDNREVSPTPSEALSVYSYVSSQNGHLILREVCGRTINNTNDYYMLPGPLSLFLSDFDGFFSDAFPWR